MRSLQTKEARTNLLNSIIERRKQNGYTLEIYKGLQILTKQDGGRYLLEVYKDNSTNAILNFYYTSEANMLLRIENTKQSYDMRNEYKAKRKEEQKGRLTGAAACADAIRAELKATFSHIKFSVRSETFAGGDAVRVSWEDGPTTSQIDEVVKKYQSGHFDGMTDMYEYSNSRTDLPQAKYITTSRGMSEATAQTLKPIAEEIYKGLENQDFGYHYENFLHRIFCITPFEKGAQAVGLVPADSNPFYKIQFNAPQVEEVQEVSPVEVEAGKVSVIEYGRGLAVVGDTKPIKEQLKAIGGRFNFRLTCGAGWVFPMAKLEEIKKLLTETAQKGKNETEEQQPNQQEPQPEQTTLKDEINKTLDFFASTDLAIYGEVTEGTKEAHRVQGVELRRHPELPHDHPLNICDPQGSQYKQALKEYRTPDHEIYSSVDDITAAAKSGKVISICNLFELVNQ